ncbi:MAG: M20/M25/M40 family metallo-hydrolase [Promethearchaeia archaeon]
MRDKKEKNKQTEWEAKIFKGEKLREAAEFLSELIQIKSVNPPGNETPAAEFCKEFLEKEGFENIELIESEPGRGNMICRWKGSNPNAKSLLLLAHLDVVPADGSNWERDPYCGDIDGEYVWGRGALDCKGMVAAEAMAAVFLKREGFQPKGDIILAFTADEEAGGEKGVGYLAENHWDKIDADYAINEGGGFLLPFGSDPKDYIVQTGEKGVFWTKIRVKGKGGHGSMPTKKKDNAIYKLSQIVEKIIDYKYPIEITPPVKEMAEKISLPGIAKRLLTSKRLIRPLTKIADFITGEEISRLILPLVMDIINPTGLKGSKKVNIIPQKAEITLDCRLLPDHDRNTIKDYIRNAVGTKMMEEIEIIPIEPTQPATVNSTEHPFWDIVADLMGEMHKGSNLVPMLSAGSTDSKFLRERGNYILGFNPMRVDPNMSYSEMAEMAHGKNERMWLPNFSYSLEFFYWLIKSM